MESSAMQYALEMEDIMSRGYGDLGTPWRLAAERKSVGIGEAHIPLHSTPQSNHLIFQSPD